MKTCSICGEAKSFDSFYVYAKNKDGLRSCCKSCGNKRSSEWAKANKKKVSEIQKRARLKGFYKLTEEEYAAMCENGCKICGSHIQLAVDHDHACCPNQTTCGKCIRGVLCKKHNTALGLVNDSVGELQAMIDYLRLAF